MIEYDFEDSVVLSKSNNTILEENKSLLNDEVSRLLNEYDNILNLLVIKLTHTNNTDQNSTILKTYIDIEDKLETGELNPNNFTNFYSRYIHRELFERPEFKEWATKHKVDQCLINMGFDFSPDLDINKLSERELNTLKKFRNIKNEIVQNLGAIHVKIKKDWSNNKKIAMEFATNV